MRGTATEPTTRLTTTVGAGVAGPLCETIWQDQAQSGEWADSCEWWWAPEDATGMEAHPDASTTSPTYTRTVKQAAERDNQANRRAITTPSF